MKLDTTHTQHLRDHVLLRCITNLNSAAVVLTALKQRYPNLKHVTLASLKAWNTLDLELKAKYDLGPQIEWDEPFKTISILRPPD